MLEYQDKIVQAVAACICDRCHRRMTPESTDFEWHERLSIAFQGGYCSVFGDGSAVSLDLCQRCVLDTLGEWLRVTTPDNDGLSYQERREAE